MTFSLSNEELTQALAELPQWRYDEARRALYRKLVLSDFAEALGLMVRIGVEAEKANHHPEWSNVYNRVEIWLTTHDTGGVSSKDFLMARSIDKIKNA